MKNVTLKHLRYLSALATHGHFGQAAEMCSISQPALSLQIKELERMSGVPLLERSARKVRLTRVGEEFLARARDILAAVDALDDLTRGTDGALTGQFRLGVIPTVAPYILPEIVTTLTQKFDGLQIVPKEAVTHALLDGLMRHDLDAALLALPISDGSLQEVPLFEEDFVLVRQRSDAQLPVPSPSLLSQMRLLLLEEGHCFRDQALSFCGAGEATARDVMEGSSLSTLVQMVGAGLGITLIPEMAVPYETRSADVAVARFHEETPKRTIGMIWRKTNPDKERLGAISQVIKVIGQRR